MRAADFDGLDVAGAGGAHGHGGQVVGTAVPPQPREVLGADCVTGLVADVNELVEDAGVVRAVPTGATETLRRCCGRGMECSAMQFLHQQSCLRRSDRGQ